MDNDKQRNVESDEGIAKKRNCSLQEDVRQGLFVECYD